jgi:hypothetical protein
MKAARQEADDYDLFHDGSEALPIVISDRLGSVSMCDKR